MGAQWLIDNNNFTEKPENHFARTLFHFSLHDFHLNSIIHNKWPVARCCPVLPPRHRTDKTIQHATRLWQQITRASARIAIASMELVICAFNTEIYTFFFMCVAFVGRGVWTKKNSCMSIIFNRKMCGACTQLGALHSRQKGSPCILCNWNRLLLLLYFIPIFSSRARYAFTLTIVFASTTANTQRNNISNIQTNNAEKSPASQKWTQIIINNSSSPFCAGVKRRKYSGMEWKQSLMESEKWNLQKNSPENYYYYYRAHIWNIRMNSFIHNIFDKFNLHFRSTATACAATILHCALCNVSKASYR